jgi:circadian clock protein KaiC
VRTNKISLTPKATTGIRGFDEITFGGLPQNRTTLLEGGPGSGKTMFAMQFLVHGARHCKEPGILVAFEEAPDRIAANFESFGWNLEELQKNQVTIFDARLSYDMVQSGEFDLSGMLAALGALANEIGAKRIVFDALDVVLTLLPDDATKRKEAYRLHEWLASQGMTGLITAKVDGDGFVNTCDSLGFLHFMADCSVILNHRVTLGVSQRNLRVQKYSGSGFDENESPFVFGKEGLDVAGTRMLNRSTPSVSNERVSSGVERLDTMLGGGYYRGASVLIAGSSGTAKTTLGGAFAEAACKRGERTIFFSFDSESAEVIRNLGSVGICLQTYVDADLLRMVSARSTSGNAETLLVHIKTLAMEHQSRCVVIDPVSTFAKAGNELTALDVSERLIDWSKAEGVTLLCTSLLNELSVGHSEGSSRLQMSTIVDTWIHLSYLVQAGERNRGLSIIKSRGSAHSNQVRELILGDKGVTLTDIYTAGGEVLMGTMRWERERSEQIRQEVAEIAEQLKRVYLEAEEAMLEVKAKSLQTKLVAKQVEMELLTRTTERRGGELTRDRTYMRELRGGDAAHPPVSAS